MYLNKVAARGHYRSRTDILRFFDGFSLLDPGLVYLTQWRPDEPSDTDADAANFGCWPGSAAVTTPSPRSLPRSAAPSARAGPPRGPARGAGCMDARGGRARRAKGRAREGAGHRAKQRICGLVN